MRVKILTTFAIVVTLANLAKADFTMTIFPSPAPNFFNSPSWQPYALNAVNSIENGLGSSGDRSTDPTAYVQLADMDPLAVANSAVASFPLWKDDATPSGPFANEHGTRVHFGLHIVSTDGDQFRLADICYKLESDEGLGATPEGLLYMEGDLSGASYGPIVVGIDYGPDRVKGGTDDVVVTGAATLFVDELAYVGIGNAYLHENPTGTQTAQDVVDANMALLLSLTPINFTGTYMLKDPNDPNNILVSESATVVFVVPEPGSTGLLAVALCAMTAKRRRRS